MNEAFCVEKWDHFSISHSEYRYYHHNPADLVILNTTAKLMTNYYTYSISNLRTTQYTLLVTKFVVGKMNVF